MLIQAHIQKLENFAALSGKEKKVLAEAITRTRTLNPDEDLLREGDRPTECHLLLEGVLCRYKLLTGGKRQITNFLVAGDLCDLCGLMMKRMDHSVGALTPATVAVIPHKTLQGLLDQHPGLARALWQEMVVDGSITREWVANTGRRSGYQRLAHLLCEVGLRLQAVGRGSSGSFEWPISQAQMADAIGMSNVHVCRMFQQLRGEGLIATDGSEIRVLDWPGLMRAGEFSPDYLYLRSGSGMTSLSH